MTDPFQYSFDLGNRPAQGREDFLVSSANEEAIAWIDRWPDWPAPALVIHGPAGSGKTHIGHVWQDRAGAAWGADASGSDARDDLRAFVIDDAEAEAGNPAVFHLYNRMASAGGHLLVLANEPAGRWSGGIPDLLSRLRAAPHVGIAPPDDTLLAGLLIKLFADRQLRVGEDVLTYILPRMDRSFDGARRIVADIDAYALQKRRNVTVPLLSEFMAEDNGH